MNKPIILVAALAAQALLPQQAHAQGRDGFSVGGLAAFGNNPYVGEDDAAAALPAIQYRSGPLSVGVQGLSYSLSDGAPLSFALGVSPRFSSLANSDADELDGIDREITADAFAQLGYAIGGGIGVEATLRQEVTGEHEGQELQFQLGYSTRVGRTAFNLGAGAKWQSEELANYVWGVGIDETAAGRPAYDAGDVVVPYLTANVVRPVTPSLAVIGRVQADFLPEEVTDSPIVEDDSVVSFGLGLSYNF